ncbi:hypothetical protein [Streptomyces sp. NPDC049881]|uniref:hypothetical protein n=1 Tax=Streptomyces sp. NPDC049881 TaxID=3155778 RepID=UPI00344A8FE2
MNSSTPDLRAVAAELHDAGLCVVPVKADGSKRPDVPSWTRYRTHRSTPDEHDRWFADRRRTGIGVIYGAVSGNVEMLEFEGRAVAEGILDEVGEVMNASGLGDVWDALTTGWVTQSPSGGMHFRARIEGGTVPGNTKLASRLAREDEHTDEDRQRLRQHPNATIVRVLIETRGEGGFGVTDPSHGTVHATGQPYVRLAGGPDSVPVIPADMMDAVRDICRMMDTVPKPEPAKTAPRETRPLPDGGVRPGDDFEARTDWTEILDGIFRPSITRGSTTYWGWADGARGVKATTGRDPARDRLYVFTTSSEFQAETPYSKFGAYALLHHGGDHKAAASELRRRGYGTAPTVRRLPDAPRPRGRFEIPPATDGTAALAPQPDPGHHDDEPPAPPELTLVHNRPRIDITNEADALDAVLDVMADGGLPDLYTRSGGPCQVTEEDDGSPIVRQLGTDNLRAYLAQHVTTYVMAKDGDGGAREERQLLMPRTCSTILGRSDWPLPPLRGIVTSPVVRPDGTLLVTPGYDPSTGLYMHPRTPLRRLRPEVTADSVTRARVLVLDTMLADFPWVAPSDRAQYLGALLSPIIRPYVPGPTPLLVITATTMGSGKTLLKDAFKYLYGLADAAWPENDQELRKAILAQMRDGGAPVIAFDNLPAGHAIRSPVLSSLLTAEVWRDRVLGASEVVSAPNDRLWVVTGNNLRTAGDNGRRVLWARLDPQVPQPDQRDGFTAGDLRPWLKANASTVVAALVTMVRSWLAAGAPRVRTRMGDYSDWASAMAGLLEHIGVPGWLEDRADAATALDDETEEWANFYEVWHERFGSEWVTARTVLTIGEDWVPATAKGDMPTSKQLGHKLKARVGRYYGPYRLATTRDTHAKQNVWCVQRAEP